MTFLVRIVLHGTMVFTLFAAGIAQAFADGDVDAISGAVLASLMALSANRLPGQRFEGTLFLRADKFVIKSTGATFICLQTLFHDVRVVHGDDGLFTGIASITTQDVVRSCATADTVFMTGFTLALIVVLGQGTFFDTEGPVSNMTADAAITLPGTEALALTFLVALFADLIASVIDPVCLCVHVVCLFGSRVLLSSFVVQCRPAEDIDDMSKQERGSGNKYGYK